VDNPVPDRQRLAQDLRLLLKALRQPEPHVVLIDETGPGSFEVYAKGFRHSLSFTPEDGLAILVATYVPMHVYRDGSADPPDVDVEVAEEIEPEALSTLRDSREVRRHWDYPRILRRLAVYWVEDLLCHEEEAAGWEEAAREADTHGQA
jgi:hypothetical protein